MDTSDAHSRFSILVVDDAPDMLRLLANLLKDRYRVQIASCGVKALELAVGNPPPDLILLDVMMPGMDGYEVCRRLKCHPSTREIPVLFLTARDREEDEETGFEVGCVDYLLKPISPPLVLARIRTHLEQRRLRLAERELMEKTLKGSLAMVVELLSLVNPSAFGWARDMADLSEQVGAALEMEEPWMVGLAAVLSQIGVLTIPDSILGKVRNRMMLNSEERETFNRVPEIGYQLLRNIPRMEEVAEVIHYAQKNYNGTGFPMDDRQGEEIPLGSRVLRVTFDFMTRLSAKESPSAAARNMLHHTAWYDPMVLRALKDVVDHGEWASAIPLKTEGIHEVAVEDLQVGQVIAYSIETANGLLLLRGNTTLMPSQLERLRNFAKVGAIANKVWIQAR
jgi:response regulator RpfG family c-di-GMP phosphodiesterase